MNIIDNQSAIREELSSTLSERLERRYRDEWIDSQHDLNVIVDLVSRRDKGLTHVKIIQSFHGSLDITRFLDALAGSGVKTVAFVGVNMDQSYSSRLARALADPNTAITCLQLCRIFPAGLANICPAVSTSSRLKELRLTFNHDLALEGQSLLMESLGTSKTLEIFKLYCVDLQQEGADMLANAVRSNAQLSDLRITSCNLVNIESIALAIKEANRITRLDLSMNRITDIKGVALLFETPSITYLSLSQNELGSEICMQTNREHVDGLFQALESNMTLKRMYLDMNPLSSEFADHLAEAVHLNTTLLRLGLLTLTVPNATAKKIRYFIALNEIGRGNLRSYPPNRNLIPHLLARASKDPQLMYGLLSEVPHTWL